MKLEVKIIGEKRKHPNYNSTETVPYTHAEATIDGHAGLIAASLRALADSIEKQP